MYFSNYKRKSNKKRVFCQYLCSKNFSNWRHSKYISSLNFQYFFKNFFLLHSWIKNAENLTFRFLNFGSLHISIFGQKKICTDFFLAKNWNMKGPKIQKSKCQVFGVFYPWMQQKKVFEKILKIEGGDVFWVTSIWKIFRTEILAKYPFFITFPFIITKIHYRYAYFLWRLKFYIILQQKNRVWVHMGGRGWL